MNSLLNFLFPTRRLLLHPEELAVSLDYHTRMNRGAVQVESEAGEARKMMFISKPGSGVRYYRGFGNYVTVNRALVETPNKI